MIQGASHQRLSSPDIVDSQAKINRHEVNPRSTTAKLKSETCFFRLTNILKAMTFYFGNGRELIVHLKLSVRTSNLI